MSRCAFAVGAPRRDTKAAGAVCGDSPATGADSGREVPAGEAVRPSASRAIRFGVAADLALSPRFFRGGMLVFRRAAVNAARHGVPLRRRRGVCAASAGTVSFLAGFSLVTPGGGYGAPPRGGR
ncbi:MAG TPA: hypothetical protein DEP05_02835 [Betaproteobacteria bacterium]|nr:hypothetical protein [Betaproteobacteria bacterium]